MKSALLVMDVQAGIIDRLNNQREYLVQAEKAVSAARASDMLVIFVVVGFREGFPEVSPKNQTFKTIKNSMAERFVQPQPALKPKKGDVVVYKRRVSAFAGSDLEVILRANAIEHIVLAGISTSGVVLSTLRRAADMDYQITVLSDLCSDSDDDVQRVLTEKVFPRQAEVTTSESWIESIAQKSK